MNRTPIARARRAGLLALAGASLALSSGCDKSEASTQPTRDTAPSKASAPTVTVAPRASTDNYTAELQATGPYKAGAEGSVELTLKAQGAYHINDLYPYKFKVQDPPTEGMSYPKLTLVRADFTFSEENKSNAANKEHKADTAKLRIPFAAARAGRATVAGTLYLSVCSDDHCVIDKTPLELGVDVK